MTPLPPYEHLELRPRDREVAAGVWSTTGDLTPEQWAQDRAFLEKARSGYVQGPSGHFWTWQPVDVDPAVLRLLIPSRRKPGIPRAVFGWLLVSLAVVVLSALAAWLLWRGFAAPSSGQQPPSTAAALYGAPLPSASPAEREASSWHGSSAGVSSGVPQPGAGITSLAVPPVSPASAGLPDTATAVAGTASWYCGGGSACTRGYPPGTLAAAAGPALRVGDWRGRIVRVCAAGTSRCVRTQLVDWCLCGHGRVIDLYREAFSRLASPSRGVLRVSVSWGGSAGTGLPPTDTP